MIVIFFNIYLISKKKKVKYIYLCILSIILVILSLFSFFNSNIIRRFVTIEF